MEKYEFSTSQTIKTTTKRTEIDEAISCHYKHVDISDAYWGVSFSKDGELVSYCSDDNNVRIRELKGVYNDGMRTTRWFTFATYSTKAIFTLFSNTKKYLLVNVASLYVVYDFESKDIIQKFPSASPYYAKADFSSDDSLIVVAHDDKTICVWDIETKDCLLKVTNPIPLTMMKFITGTDKIIFSLLSCDGCYVYDYVEQSAALICKIYQSHIITFCLSPNSNYIYLGLEDGSIVIHDYKLDALCKYVETAAIKMNSMDITSDGKRLFVLYKDMTISVYNVEHVSEVGLISEFHSLNKRQKIHCVPEPQQRGRYTKAAR